MKNNTLLLYFLTLAALFTWQCKGCKDNDCPDGYKSNDGICECPDGSYEAQGLCRPLKDNEYYAKAEACACQDSAFFQVGEKITDPATGNVSVTIKKIVGVKGNVGEHIVELRFLYYALPSGEILLGHNLISGCDINGVQTNATFRAEYLPGDSIRLLQMNDNYAISNPVRDTCVWILHK